MKNDEVGEYVNGHFYSSFQKVGTFRIVNNIKVGGNVVTYFCQPDGTVLHALAGPTDAARFFVEARWVVETRKNALTEPKNTPRSIALFTQKAHAERYLEEYANAHLDPLNLIKQPFRGPFPPPFTQGQRVTKLPPARPYLLPPQAQVHWLLGSRLSPKLADIYKTVYQDILREKISTLPVQQR